MIIGSKPFLFMRHGETDWNQKRLYMGCEDVPINLTGMEQAKDAARLLESYGLKHIVTSPLSRALATGEIIARHLGIELLIMDELKQCNWGSQQGKKFDDGSMIKQWLQGITPEGAESHIEFDNRILRGLLKTLELDGLSLIVSHGGVYRAIRRILEYPFGDFNHCAPYIHLPPKPQQPRWIIEEVSQNEPIRITV